MDKKTEACGGLFISQSSCRQLTIERHHKPGLGFRVPLSVNGFFRSSTKEQLQKWAPGFGCREVTSWRKSSEKSIAWYEEAHTQSTWKLEMYYTNKSWVVKTGLCCCWMRKYEKWGPATERSFHKEIFGTHFPWDWYTIAYLKVWRYSLFRGNLQFLNGGTIVQ